CVQSAGHFPRYKSAMSGCRPHYWSPRFAPRNRDNPAKYRADLSASSSFSLCCWRDFFQCWHRLSFIVPELQDAEKILRSVIQCQSCGEIVAEKQEDKGHKHHQPALGWIPSFGSHSHQPHLRGSHKDGQDVDRQSDAHNTEDRDPTHSRNNEQSIRL